MKKLMLIADTIGEPQVLPVPDTEACYYVMPFVDAWPHAFASD